MKNLIGIISDTHDNKERVESAIRIFNSSELTSVIHCGDFVAPFTLALFKKLKTALIGVFGNCDGERAGLKKKAQELGFTLKPPPYRLELSGKKITISHQPINPPKGTDILIHGHTHKPIIIEQNPLIINPGEAAGWLTGKATIAILDLDTLKCEIISL